MASILVDGFAYDRGVGGGNVEAGLRLHGPSLHMASVLVHGDADRSAWAEGRLLDGGVDPFLSTPPPIEEKNRFSIVVGIFGRWARRQGGSAPPLPREQEQEQAQA
jgi:hypothetical protein